MSKCYRLSKEKLKSSSSEISPTVQWYVRNIFQCLLFCDKVEIPNLNFMIKKTIFVGIILFLFTATAVFWSMREIRKQEGQVQQVAQQQKTEKNKQVEDHDDPGTENVKIKPPNREDWRVAEWKTYKDKKNGFEIKYPETFSPEILDISSYVNYQEGDVLIMHKDTVRYLRELNYAAAQIDYSVYITIKENKRELSLLDWIIENNHQYNLICKNEHGHSMVSCEDVEIDTQVELIKIKDKEALLMREASIMDNSIILFSLEGKIVQFHLNGEDIRSNDGDNFFARMMETFKRD